MGLRETTTDRNITSRCAAAGHRRWHKTAGASLGRYHHLEKHLGRTRHNDQDNVTIISNPPTPPPPYII